MADGEQGSGNEEFNRFEQLTRSLLNVPKAEVDQLREWHDAWHKVISGPVEDLLRP